MIHPRIYPVLLIHEEQLYKTINFENHKYIGDPINAVKIFNEKHVDELMICDIDATVNSTEPNYSLLSDIAEEARMPLCYAGGLKKYVQLEKIIQIGFEKVGVSSSCLGDIEFIKDFSNSYGSQSINIILDIKEINNEYFIFTHNGKKNTLKTLDDFNFSEFEKYIGEFIFNSIDRDGTMIGLDQNLLKKIEKISPKRHKSIIGGIGNFEHIRSLFSNFKNINLGVGSFFLYKGGLNAVLLNYLSNENRNELFINFDQ